MWPFSRSCQSKVRLVGKTVVITGANTGIGKETARDLYRRGARVILACRDLEKANAAIDDIKKNPPSKPDRPQFNGDPGELAAYKLNLCSLASVKECAKNLLENEPAIHILVNNAGIMMCPYSLTEDGFESQFQSNHLGHFLLTLLLLPKIRASVPGCRVINLSSIAHSRGDLNLNDLNDERKYTPLSAYAQSKLANILFAKELATRLKEAGIDGINTYSLHPGVVATELGRHFDAGIFRGARTLFNLLFPLIKKPEDGAQTTIYCAVDEEAGKETGLYYKECSVACPSRKATSEKLAKELWTRSIEFLKLEYKENLDEQLKTVSQQISSGNI